MSEELNNPNEESVEIEVELPEAVEEEAPVELTREQEIEQQARAQGWTPRENFKGHESDYVGPAEFVRRGELFSKIADQKQELLELRGAVNSFGDLIKAEREKAAAEERARLEQKRVEAIQEGDVDQVNYLDNEIRKQSNKEVAPAPKTEEAPVQVEHPSEALDFQQRNAAWFNQDNIANKAMMTAAIEAEQQLMASNPDMPLAERLRQVEVQIQEAFPHRFKNANRERPAAVTMGSGEAKSQAKNTMKVSYASLSDRQKRVYNSIKQSNPDYKLETYVNSLIQSGAIKNN